MSEKELYSIIAKNINRYMDLRNLKQTDIAEYMNCSQPTVSSWCNGAKLPRMDRIDKLCELFGITRSDLMEDKESDSLQQEEELARRLLGNHDAKYAAFKLLQEMTEEEAETSLKILEAYTGGKK